MSLTVSASAPSIEPIPEGTYLAVCCSLVDLGMQYNERFNNTQRKVLIEWELPELTYENKEGVTKTRRCNNRYTASLNDRGNLRRDLAAWRGRDFTEAELEEFNLCNIVGKSCLINIVHTTGKNGNTYANISGIVALPKSMQPGKLSEPPVVIDLDNCSLDDVDNLPNRIGDQIRKSLTYQDMLKKDQEIDQALAEPKQATLSDLEDDGDLPF